ARTRERSARRVAGFTGVEREIAAGALWQGADACRRAESRCCAVDEAERARRLAVLARIDLIVATERFRRRTRAIGSAGHEGAARRRRRAVERRNGRIAGFAGFDDAVAASGRDARAAEGADASATLGRRASRGGRIARLTGLDDGVAAETGECRTGGAGTGHAR